MPINLKSLLTDLFSFGSKKKSVSEVMSPDELINQKAASLKKKTVDAKKANVTTSATVSIDSLELNNRYINALKSAGIKTVGDLNAMSDSDLLSIKGIGEKVLCSMRKEVVKIEDSAR